jgi:signal peptidase II
VGLAVDLLTKYWVANTLRVGEVVPLLGRVLQFTLVYNKGAIFGLDPRALNPAFPTNGVFYVFSLIALVVLVVYYRNLKGESMLMHWGVALITPGALGNLFDRLFYPSRGVVDFIMVNLGFPPFNPWPIFNVADIFITVGVGIILVEFLRESLTRRGDGKGG